MRVILSGGGTAGHINPALAIAQELAAHYDAQVLFIGTPNGMENRRVAEAGFPIRHVDVEGLRRSLSLKNLKVAVKYLRSVGRAKKIIREFGADLAIGTGGYVCAPVMKAAAKLGIPTMVHEQNVIPGVTVKMLAKSANKVAISFRETMQYLPNTRCIYTGNPLRQELFEHHYRQSRESLSLPERPFVVMFGGSLGAERMNDALVELVRHGTNGAFTLLAATGEKHYDAVMKRIGSHQDDNVRIVPYIHNMGEVMAAADVLICRAGAITISEICVLGKASILIPSPYVAHNHQEFNARALEKNGACRVLLEKELTHESLAQAIESLAGDECARRSMGQEAKKMGMPDATERICEEAAALVARR